MSQAPVTQFGAPDAPFCDLATARVTIIPAPLEYSVCYMKGTERGPQAIDILLRCSVADMYCPSLQ
jgi:agmatinase